MNTNVFVHTDHRRLPLTVLAIVTALSLVACSKSGTHTPPAAGAPAPAPAPAAPASAPVAEATNPAEKLQVYIECYNRLDGVAHRSLSHYASWVKNMDTAPTGNERMVYGQYSISTDEVAACKKSMTAAAAQKPTADKFDAAATAYIGALEALDETVAEADRNYSRENYKDDKFAKGKELHAPLAEEGKAFQQASDIFSHEPDAENDKSLAARLVHIEKTEGRKLTYWRMSLMARAKQLAQVPGEDEFAVDDASTRLAAYESTTDDAMKYGAANKSELPTTWFTIESAAEDYRKAAKQRLRRVRDKVPYSEGEKMMLKPGSGWMVEGSQEQFTKAYNSLIEASNRLH